MAAVLLTVLSQLISNAAAGSDATMGNRWLMMVTTQSTDPAREAEFNDWYDRIDIPDVLEVPGYMRARRGQGQRVPEFPNADLQDDEGKYVALYDIESEAIDKTIIEMLMATRKMEQRGRSTDLLRVVERVYYRQQAPAIERSSPASSGGHAYLYVVKIDCCHDEAAERQFAEWYDATYAPAILGTDGFIRVTRYRLYRVLMTDPIPMPNFLAVYEIEAESAEQAMKNMFSMVEKLHETGQMSALYAEGGSTVYLTINDTRRN